MLALSYSETYLALTIPFIIFWIGFLIFSKKTRKEQLIMSLLFLPLGPLSEILYFKDYWLPKSIFPLSFFSLTIFPEDLIFGFCIAGIGAVVYEVFLGKRLQAIKTQNHIGLLVILIIAAVVTLPLWLWGMNSIFTTSIGFIVVALLIIAQRKDLLMHSLISGLGVMIIMFISYILLFKFVVANTDELYKQGWLIYGTKYGKTFWNVPLTEMIWGFSWGMMIGPLYEFMKKVGHIK